MARKTISDIAALLNITLEGNLIAPAMLAKVERLDADGQSEADYAVKPGLTIRDEIPRAFRIGQALFSQFAGSDTTTAGATLRFVTQMLTDVFGFSDLQTGGRRQNDGRDYLVHLEAGDGRIPVIVVPPKDTIDRASEALAFDERKRSASTALQDWLNAEDDALWGLATNGDVIRLMRDNASLTRPAFVEADLKQIFETEDYSSFSALWLLLHRSRFGDKPAPVTDCALERWRDTGSKEGAVVRDRLRDGVEDALRVFGSGFLEANPDLRKRLSDGDLKLTVFFNELLRIIYRLIFLMVAEDRDLLHDPDASPAMRGLYAEGYSLKRLRERSIRRSNWDKHRDLYEGLKIVFRSLATGQSKLGLPALGGLFDQGLMPDLDKATLPNRALMEAVYRLAWLKEKDALLPINWREMETEELGSVYESLLELTPRIDIVAKRFYFAEGEETKGNQRKTTSSYYTPDSLVQVLLDSALDPVLDRIEREADDPADALTKATVIDPACGSGHFLLAAARRIATRVARIRAGGVASATDFRHALRDVARGCIHGVDRNPMAVELTKVALWIETVEPGKPLGFLDANIRCGDALLGVFDLSVLREGIPDAAYKPLTGDDKDVAKYYREKNKRERKERSRVESGFGFERQRDFIKDYERVRAMPEDTVRQVDAKTTALQALVANGSALWELQQACDLYIASFLLPKIKGSEHAGLDGLPQRGREIVPSNGAVWEYLRGTSQFGPMMGASIEISRSARAFHWPLEFPSAMSQGGFDVIVGNPPWDQVALEDVEFFASRDLNIATTKKTAVRKKLIAELKTSNATLYSEYIEAVRVIACYSNYIRVCGRFPYGGVGKVNTYAAFADHFRNSINGLGRAGIILPTGIMTGYTYREFVKHLLANSSLVSFYGFENEDLLFKDIHHAIKFGVLTIAGLEESIDKAWLTAHIRDPAEISDVEKRYALSVKQIAAINPNTMNLPAFRMAKDAEVTAQIHSVADVLRPIKKAEGDNTHWDVELGTLFNMSSDSNLFLDHQEISPRISSYENAAAILKNGSKVYPLYEGKMFWHFDHRYGTYFQQTEAQANQGVLPHVSDELHTDPNFKIQPRYWVEADVLEKALGDNTSDWIFAWRDVGPSERTFVGTILPRTALGDVAPYFSLNCDAIYQSAFFAMCSSLVVDYAARQKSSRMSLFVVEQLPILSKSTVSAKLDWLPETLAVWLANRYFELTYTAFELNKYAFAMGRSHPPFKWSSERRKLLQAEIDAVMLHLYGLNKSQATWLLDTFTVLRNYEERDYDEFRTKDLVLEIYEAMEDSKAHKKAYQTRLSPIPADTSLCHSSDLPKPFQLQSLSNISDNSWAWPKQDERDRIRAQLRATIGITSSTGDAQRVRLATLACLNPSLLTGFLTHDDRNQWQRLVGLQSTSNTSATRLTPPTNAAWGHVFNELVSAAVVDVSSDGNQWSAGPRLDLSTLNPDDPSVGRALFAWSRLQSVDLEQGLTQIPAEILPFIREGRLAA